MSDFTNNGVWTYLAGVATGLLIMRLFWRLYT
jgi:hypothetical protein